MVFLFLKFGNICNLKRRNLYYFVLKKHESNLKLSFTLARNYVEEVVMVLQVDGVTKVFTGRKKSKIIANEMISFNIKKGEILGLLGQNGAGKTTLVSQILGVEKPTSGDIILLGQSVIKNPEHGREVCSVQPQSQLPLGFMTPAQAVSIMGRMRGGQEAEVNKRMNHLFEKLDISQWANVESAKLSGGVRRLTAFCMAVIVPGSLVILDEPTNDVDPMRRRYLWDVIRSLTDDGTAVILVTHNVLEADKAVDRVAIMHNGKFLAEGTPSEVKSRVNSQIRLEVSQLHDLSDINTLSWALSSHHKGGKTVFSVRPDAAASAIEWAGKQVESGSILDYALSPTTLEDVYIELTGKELTVE